jgi:phosphatidylinositol 3-kinase
LSGGKSFQNPITRQYAVDVLRKASDNELRMVLLQLVQALRYEHINESNIAYPANAVHSDPSASTVVVQINDSAEPKLSDLSPLGILLIERACSSTVGRNIFLPYLIIYNLYIFNI